MESIAEQIAEAIKAGRITEAELNDLLTKKPDVKLQETVDLIHTLFCQKTHSIEMESNFGECSYYQEQILTDGWHRIDHTKWTKATTLLLDASCSTCMGLQKDLKALRVMMVDSWEGKPRNPIVVALYFFINFIGDDEKFFNLAKRFIEETS
jgi:hypothetical protein